MAVKGKPESLCLSLRKEPRSSGAAGLEETYQSYLASKQKRRSWAADNAGNIAIRTGLLESILELASENLNRDGKILDVGCGGGWLLNQLAQRGVQQQRLHGIDLIEARVAAARSCLPDADIRIADARRLPYPDREFDLVALLTCLSSMPNRNSIDLALDEANRVLAPNGLLLCYEPRFANPLNRGTLHLPQRMLRKLSGPPSDSRLLTGFPPIARRLRSATPRVYPWLAWVAPTHRLTAWTSTTTHDQQASERSNER